MANLYSRNLGLVMVAPLWIAMLVWFFRMPREQKTHLAARMREQERTPLGRVRQVLEMLVMALVAAGVLMWLYQRWQ